MSFPNICDIIPAAGIDPKQCEGISVDLTPSPAPLYCPEISVRKYVSADGGLSWYNTPVAPGINISSNVEPKFKFVVFNTGNVPLTLVSLSDSVYGPLSVGGDLAPGEFFETVITKPWGVGLHENEAVATGNFGAVTVTGTAFAHYNGVQIDGPAIQIVKYVSPDGGATWTDANFIPGPTIYSNVSPSFKFVVTNTGTEPLSNIGVTDDVYGPIGAFPFLAPGESTAFYHTVPWEFGIHTNKATVTSAFGVSDDSRAYYTGVEAAPSITLQKYVSADGGVTWEDAEFPPGPSIYSDVSPQFLFVVTNVGNVPLTDVEVKDSVYGVIGLVPTLAAGKKVAFIRIAPWQAGAHINIATVTSTFDTQTITDSDMAHYFGANPGISIVKYVSVDNGASWLHANTPPGPRLPNGVTPKFKYEVKNTGNVQLTNIVITDNVLGDIETLPELAAGDSKIFFA